MQNFEIINNWCAIIVFILITVKKEYFIHLLMKKEYYIICFYP
jgi:hypothetical protein